MSTYKTRVVGALNTLEYKMYIEESGSGKIVSPFHDIPLFADASGKVLNMVVEIPRWTNAKMEVHRFDRFCVSRPYTRLTRIDLQRSHGSLLNYDIGKERAGRWHKRRTHFCAWAASEPVG